MSLANSAGRQTMKLDPSSFHEMTSSTEGSSTSWYVFVRKGVGSDRCDASAAVDSAFCSTGGGAMPVDQPTLLAEDLQNLVPIVSRKFFSSLS
ncbi:hypothetical protein ACLOJK_006194 [Asimina triloba]